MDWKGLLPEYQTNFLPWAGDLGLSGYGRTMFKAYWRSWGWVSPMKGATWVMLTWTAMLLGLGICFVWPYVASSLRSWREDPDRLRKKFQGILSIPAFADTIRKVLKAINRLSINNHIIKRRRNMNKIIMCISVSPSVVSKPDNWDDGHSHKWRGTRWVQGGVRNMCSDRGRLYDALLGQHLPAVRSRHHPAHRGGAESCLKIQEAKYFVETSLQW